MLVLSKMSATIRAGQDNGDAMFLEDAAQAGKWFQIYSV
jgi:hypothetical protein